MSESSSVDRDKKYTELMKYTHFLPYRKLEQQQSFRNTHCPPYRKLTSCIQSQ